jgi:plastocyanin
VRTTPSGTTHVIHLSGYSFSPADLTIAVGDSVRAVVDGGTHTFTSSAGPKSWDSGGMSAGQSYTVTFTTAGSYTFLCSYHSSLGMTGKLTVR